jgi:hypothetical protein
MKTLETKKAKLLEEKEMDWRMKSKAIWLDLGDQKKIHNFANHRSNINTIL